MLPLDSRDKARLVKEYQVNLEAWPVIMQDNRANNVHGKVPQLKAKLGGDSTNKELAKKWGVTPRQASKIRNRRIPVPQSVLASQESIS